jgi:hypothetical protein
MIHANFLLSIPNLYIALFIGFFSGCIIQEVYKRQY